MALIEIDGKFSGFTELKHGGSFHGKLLVITRFASINISKNHLSKIGDPTFDLCRNQREVKQRGPPAKAQRGLAEDPRISLLLQ